jgi:glucose/arabinose dehydrogenase
MTRSSSLPRLATATAILLALGAPALAAGNAQCPGEDVFFDPGQGQDIFVPPGYKVEVFAKGLNFPSNIAFRTTASGFEAFVTEAGDSLPGRCNSEDTFAAMFPTAANPFLADIAVLNKNGAPVRILAKAPNVAQKGDPRFVHAPTIGVTFEDGFSGRMFVTDSRQGIRGAQGPRNSSRVLQVDPQNGAVTQLVTGLPTGDHPTEQITVHDGFLYWSQGSATNSGVVGHDNGGPVGGPPDTEAGIQHEIPCTDIVLSGNNLDSGDGHHTGGYLPHGNPSHEGQVVKAFTGATQAGMCTGAILRASLTNPQGTVEPFSWGYRNPFGLRFAPEDHPLKGGLFVTENGEDERGARPTNNAPDRLQVAHGGLDHHGWPDRFGFLDSTQALFTPVGGPNDDSGFANPQIGKPVPKLLDEFPRPPVSPIAIEPTDVAVVGTDFVGQKFSGGGNPGDTLKNGDALVTREGDFGFSTKNGTPIEGHDIQLVHFFKNDGGLHLERFAFNCKAGNQVPGNAPGSKVCVQAEDQAFVAGIHGINRPVDGKFGPDGAFYLVDFGAVRDVGRSTAGAKFTNPADAPLVQIPGTGVIWRISKVGDRNDDNDRDDD